MPEGVYRSCENGTNAPWHDVAGETNVGAIASSEKQAVGTDRPNRKFKSYVKRHRCARAMRYFVAFPALTLDNLARPI